MKNRLFTFLKFFLGWPLSILALFFVIKVIGPQAPQFFSRLHEVSLPLLSVSMFSFFIYFFLRGYFWQRMIRHAGYEHISYKKINFIWAASELHRYIPGNIWSFVGRTVRLAEQGMSKKDIAKCTLFEMQFLVFGTAGASILAIPFLQTYFNLSQTFVFLLLITFIAGVLLFAFHRKLGIKLFFLPDYPPFESVFLIIISALLFFFFGLGYYFAIVSFIFIDPNLIWQIVGISILSYLVGYLSLITPSGIGVREGALAFGLAKIIPVGAAGFVALFARFVMTFTEVLYVIISYLWYHTKNSFLHRVETWIGNNKQLMLLIFFMITYVGYFTTVSFLRYDNFYTGKYDLGNMAQTVWNTTQGQIFMLTNPDTGENVSRLAIHADFILILLTPFYAVWSDPRMLLLIQTLVLALGALFVYFIGNYVIKNKNLSLVFAFAYLLNPSVQRVNLYDFHGVALATTFLLATFYFYLKKNYKMFLIFAILAGLCKEDVWIIIGLFGIFLFFQHKKRLFGVILFALCFLLSYFLISYAIPQSLGSSHFALSYFSQYGDNPLSIVIHILLQPGELFATIFQDEKIIYLQQLFSPLGYLSLIAPHFLLFIMPNLAINLLSSNANLHQIYYQYTATITPFLFIAAIYSVIFIKKLLVKNNNETMQQLSNPLLIIYLISISFYTAYLDGPLPGARDANLDMITKQVSDRESITKKLSEIPQNVSVAASNNLGAQLANREYLSVLPLGIEQADYIIFYLTQSQSKESLEKDQVLIAQIKQNPNYELVTEQGILSIFKKRSY